MSNRISMLIDGNNFSFKALSVYDGIKGRKLFNIHEERDEFLRLLAGNFINEISRFKPVLSRIIITADSRSWRREIYPEYKGHRELDPDVNWENYGLLVKEFYSILEESGIIISRTYQAEGDDLIYQWSKYLNSVGESVVIISMDRDLSQLVNYNNGVFTVQYDSTRRCKGFFADQKFYDSLDNGGDIVESVADIFSISDLVTSKESIGEELSNVLKGVLKHTPSNIIDVDTFVFEKVLRGDKGDNIYSPYTYMKGKRRMGIGEKGAEKIINNYNFKKKFEVRDLFDSDRIDQMSSLVIEGMKITKDKDPLVKKGIDLNTRLMFLSEKVIPSKVVSEMEKDIKRKISYELNLENLRNVETLLKNHVKDKNSNLMVTLF
jgi:5'-3' exonuclease